jgi:hypothetical protein
MLHYICIHWYNYDIVVHSHIYSHIHIYLGRHKRRPSRWKSAERLYSSPKKRRQKRLSTKFVRKFVYTCRKPCDFFRWLPLLMQKKVTIDKICEEICIYTYIGNFLVILLLIATDDKLVRICCRLLGWCGVLALACVFVMCTCMCMRMYLARVCVCACI